VYNIPTPGRVRSHRLRAKAEAILANLRAEAVDDDIPRVPELDALASAQSRRAVKQ